MKDKISDFFGSITERMKSPLLFSFAVSWLFTNWKVWVILFFYSNEEVCQIHNISKIEFIQNQFDYYHTLWIPLLCAVLYILLIKVGYRWVEGWILRSGNWLFENSSKKSMVGIETIVRIRNEYEIREENLKSLLLKQEEREKKIEKLNNEISTIQSKLDYNLDLNSRNSASQDPNVLIGRWEFLTGNLANTNKFSEESEFLIEFQGTHIMYRYDKKEGQTHLGSIQLMKYTPSNGRILMIVNFDVDINIEKLTVWDLEFRKDKTVLIGEINNIKAHLKKVY